MCCITVSEGTLGAVSTNMAPHRWKYRTSRAPRWTELRGDWYYLSYLILTQHTYLGSKIEKNVAMADDGILANIWGKL